MMVYSPTVPSPNDTPFTHASLDLRFAVLGENGKGAEAPVLGGRPRMRDCSDKTLG